MLATNSTLCYLKFGAMAFSVIFALPKNRLTGVDLVAQLVEHNTFNVGALGSSPSGITTIKAFSYGGFFITRILKYVCNHKQ